MDIPTRKKLLLGLSVANFMGGSYALTIPNLEKKWGLMLMGISCLEYTGFHFGTSKMMKIVSSCVMCCNISFLVFIGILKKGNPLLHDPYGLAMAATELVFMICIYASDYLEK
eukprot:TRINITY_DN8664_c0_g1_i1.p1 TRINITY_DN8664_c0_g1~~TRINITY_DN8664_c0_g1_i1.p1  ORF type:complete len:113 (-),score=13.16 TRINITY_DN8664_c0_g1_i1:17-355(-)